ncbi:unnamed protein product [Moneuplotes crassus]|uniref:Protein kinase domain-containing protein n=1 Tax=Euplotes crassus TaxID=5936 RepID=A0AAD2CY12_EUPCR|nr:unnamed protein product [Moneuplotes crassus]
MGAAICSCNKTSDQITFSSGRPGNTNHGAKRLLPGGETPIWREKNIYDKKESLSTSSISDDTDLSNFAERFNIRRDPINKSYKLGKIIGLSFSTIIREGFDLSNTDRKVFIRSLEWESINSEAEDYMDVLRRQQKIDHPNICGVEEYFRDEDYLYIVTEFSEGIYLKDFIFENKCSDECATMIIHQLLDCVKYLNSLGFYKNNISVNNIKIDPDSLEIKLENFDLPYQFKGLKSKFIDYSSNSRVTRQSIKDDLHSIGVVTSKICSQKDEITLDFINKCCGDSKGPRLSVEKAFDHGFFYFRSYQKSIYDDSTKVICSLSSVHDSDCSFESSIYPF